MIKHPRSTRRNNPNLELFFEELSNLVRSYDITLLKSMGDLINLVTYYGDFPEVEALSLSYGADCFLDQQIFLQNNPVIINGPVMDPDIEKVARSMYDDTFKKPDAGIKSNLVIPIEAPENERYFLIISTRDRQSFTSEELQIAYQFSLQHVSTIENAVYFREILLKGIIAEQLFTIQQAISRDLSQEVIHQLIVDQACDLSFAETSLLLLKEGDHLVVVSTSGLPLPGLTPGKVLPNIIDQAEGMEKYFDNSCLSAVLPAKSEPIGTLVVVNKKIGSFDDHDVRSIQMLASAAGIGLENANLLEKISQISVLEERERLAIEFHDSLGQSISYLKMESSLIQKHVSEGKFKQAELELEQHGMSLDDTFLMLRMAIFNLRFPLDEETSFVTALQNYLKEYSSRSGIQVSLNGLIDADPVLSYDTKLQLIRIFQEALTNARRHADATLISVQVTREPKYIVLEIKDNGKGFLLDELMQQKKDHYGLHIMQERAKTFGGNVEIISEPGKGTTVKVKAPEEYQGIIYD